MAPPITIYGTSNMACTCNYKCTRKIIGTSFHEMTSNSKTNFLVLKFTLWKDLRVSIFSSKKSALIFCSKAVPLLWLYLGWVPASVWLKMASNLFLQKRKTWIFENKRLSWNQAPMTNTKVACKWCKSPDQQKAANLFTGSMVTKRHLESRLCKTLQ